MKNWGKPGVLLDLSWKGCFRAGRSTSALWEPEKEGPPISMIIRNREKLDLSSDQVRNLERLRKDFEKQSIRKEADIRVAKLDLHALLDAQPVDMTKVEAKVREIERLRADLRFARIRAAQKAKEQLSVEHARNWMSFSPAESQFTLFQP